MEGQAERHDYSADDHVGPSPDFIRNRAGRDGAEHHGEHAHGECNADLRCIESELVIPVEQQPQAPQTLDDTHDGPSHGHGVE